MDREGFEKIEGLAKSAKKAILGVFPKPLEGEDFHSEYAQVEFRQTSRGAHAAVLRELGKAGVLAKSDQKTAPEEAQGPFLKVVKLFPSSIVFRDLNFEGYPPEETDVQEANAPEAEPSRYME